MSERRLTSAWNAWRDRRLARAPWLRDLLDHLIQMRIMDSATVLAAKTFMAVLPVLVVVCTLLPESSRAKVRESLRELLGLSGASLDQVDALFAAPESAATQAFGAIAFVVTVLSATSCSRSLQRLCERCWNLPHAAAASAAWRWLVWLGVLLVALLTGGTIRKELGVGSVLGLVVTLLANTLLWWWTQHLLLAGRVGWRPLFPGALIAGVSVTCMLAASRLYMPEALNRAIARYGPLGSVFTVLGWLIGVGFVLTVTLAAGYVIADRSPFSRFFADAQDTGPTARKERR